MNKKIKSLLIAAALTLPVLAATTATAGPDCDNPKLADNPHCATTTTTTVPDGTTVPDDGVTTCLDVGSAWNHGAWDATAQAYTAETLPICIDLTAEPTHRTLTQWKVTWSGTSARSTKKGAEAILIFEEQVHSNSYASNKIALASRATAGEGSWEAHLDLTGAEPASLVFIAMPHSGARWTSFSVTVEPVLP